MELGLILPDNMHLAVLVAIIHGAQEQQLVEVARLHTMQLRQRIPTHVLLIVKPGLAV